MNLYQKRNILLVGFAVWLLLAMLFGRILPEEIALYINLLLFGAMFLLIIKWWRCPYCLSYLGRFQFPTITCPCCGKDIPKKQQNTTNMSNSLSLRRNFAVCIGYHPLGGILFNSLGHRSRGSDNTPPGSSAGGEGRSEPVFGGFL